MVFDDDSSFWAKENYNKGFSDGRKLAVKILNSEKRLKRAEKIIKKYCMCDSEWTSLRDKCEFCKYKRKYLDK